MFLKRSLVWTKTIFTHRRDGKPFLVHPGGGQTHDGPSVSATAARALSAIVAAPNSSLRRSIIRNRPFVRQPSGINTCCPLDCVHRVVWTSKVATVLGMADPALVRLSAWPRSRK